jgi:serine/threonine protein phosphatase 1
MVGTSPGFDRRVLAIGDIHGCSTALMALIEGIQPCSDDLIIVLGDFIDCGPDSRGVIEQLIALKNRCQLVLLLGNHEEMLLNAVESKSEYKYWLKLGGQQTLDSYCTYWTDIEVIPAEHIRFIRGCRDYFETETHIFVHANYDPSLPLNRISGTKLRWEHLRPHECCPHFSGKTVVIGHTPQATGKVLDMGFLVAIDTDCFRGGWLTALDVTTGEVIQANQQGEVRRSLTGGRDADKID